MNTLRYKYDARGKRIEADIDLSAHYENSAPRLIKAHFDDNEARQHKNYNNMDYRLSITVAIEDKDVGELLSMIKKISVPIDPRAKSDMGFDGDHHQIMIDRGLCSTTYNWWIDLPKGWGLLGKLEPSAPLRTV